MGSRKSSSGAAAAVSAEMVDLALGTGTLLAPDATLRALGHDEPSPDARHLFRRCGPIWLTFAAAHAIAARRNRPEDWWALAWLRGTEVATDIVIVVGDVNSTVACSLTAVKRGIPVAHVEAGLRSFDWEMPEEINRLVTDRLSSLLFTPSRDGDENLLKEGRPAEAIHFVGNVMVDTLLRFRDKAARSDVLSRIGVAAGEYAVLTLHRPRNVDTREAFSGMLDAFAEIAGRVPIVYPMHPRSRKTLTEAGLLERAEAISGLIMTGPLGYLDFIELEARAGLVMTDSGGVQEETTVLGVPCLTLRPNTERPTTITEGTNKLVGTSPDAITEAATGILDEEKKPSGRLPELWDGHASERIAGIIWEYGQRS